MRKSLAAVCVAVVIAVGSLSVSSAQQQAGLAPAELNKLIAGFAAAWNAGDVNTIGGYYTNDAVRIGPNGVLTGRAAIQKYYGDTLAGELKGSKMDLQVEGSSSPAPGVMVVHGRFTISGATPRSGHYLNTMVRQESGWLVAASAISMAMPTP